MSKNYLIEIYGDSLNNLNDKELRYLVKDLIGDISDITARLENGNITNAEEFIDSLSTINEFRISMQ